MSLGQSVFFIEGWIKLHRKTLESSVFQNEKALKVWIWCLLRANHKATKIPWNGKDFNLRAGQFITGRKAAAAELEMSERNFRTALAYLISTGRLTSKTTNKFSVITVTQWAFFQHDEKKRPAYRPTNDQQTTTDKNDKNIKTFISLEETTPNPDASREAMLRTKALLQAKRLI